MLGNALEALIGAIYLDVGYKKTQRFVIKKILKTQIDIRALETYDDNYKSQLLEWCQKNRKEVAYKVLEKFKLDNRDRFKVGVLIDGNQLGLEQRVVNLSTTRSPQAQQTPPPS